MSVNLYGNFIFKLIVTTWVSTQHITNSVIVISKMPEIDGLTILAHSIIITFHHCEQSCIVCSIYFSLRIYRRIFVCKYVFWATGGSIVAFDGWLGEGDYLEFERYFFKASQSERARERERERERERKRERERNANFGAYRLYVSQRANVYSIHIKIKKIKVRDMFCCSV